MALERTTNKSECIFGLTSLTWRGYLHHSCVCVGFFSLFIFISVLVDFSYNRIWCNVCRLHFKKIFFSSGARLALALYRRPEEQTSEKKTIRAKRLRFVSLLLLSVHTPHSHTASSSFDLRFWQQRRRVSNFKLHFDFDFSPFVLCFAFLVFVQRNTENISQQLSIFIMHSAFGYIYVAF